MSNSKTKKIRNSINKKKLWNDFKENTQVECVYQNEKKNNDFCNTCSSSLYLGEEGYYICTNKSCAIIYKDALDYSAEWRFYGSEDANSSDPTRCGMPVNPLLKESSFGCKVVCPYATSYEMKKIRRYTEWQSMPYKEKADYDVFQRISILANHSGIPKLIIDDAMSIYQKISNGCDHCYRGLNRDGIIAASIYVSAKINDFPRTSKEIAIIFNLDNTSATKGCKNAISIINELELSKETKTTFSVILPSSFIDRYCSKLNINKELTKLALFIAQIIQKNNLIPENTPHSIASGIIYFVCQECNVNINKREIHNISEISEVTINKCYKKLLDMKHELIPKKIYDKYN